MVRRRPGVNRAPSCACEGRRARAGGAPRHGPEGDMSPPAGRRAERQVCGRSGRPLRWRPLSALGGSCQAAFGRRTAETELRVVQPEWAVSCSNIVRHGLRFSEDLHVAERWTRSTGTRRGVPQSPSGSNHARRARRCSDPAQPSRPWSWGRRSLSRSSPAQPPPA